MKKFESKLIFSKVALIATAFAITFASCQEETDLKEPGALVPKTVDLDPSLPSISVNGTRLHAEAFGNPADPMVVFLHGGPGCDYKNAMNVKQLTTNGYYVVFYDQRGSGLSQRHDKSTYTMQLMIDDLTAVIAHYRTSPNQKIFLFGHSWGAMLAAAYINQHPTWVDGTILAEPGGFTDEMVEEYGERSRKIKLLAEATNDVLYLDQFLTGRENEHEILDYKLSIVVSYAYSKDNDEGVEGPFPYWRYGYMLLSRFEDIASAEGFDFTQNLHQFAPKVLFLYSENNTAYGLNHAQKLAAYFNSTTITEVKDTGHEMIYFKWENVYTPALNYLESLN